MAEKALTYLRPHFVKCVIINMSSIPDRTFNYFWFDKDIYCK